MRDEDGARFNRLYTGMSRMYGVEPDQVVANAYWIALADWTIEDVETAASHLMATSEHMPRPAHFTALRKAKRMTSNEAWEIALQACAHGGAGISDVPALLDRVVRAIGGWDLLRFSDDRSLSFVHRDFIHAFEQIDDAEEVRQAVPAIAAPDEPALIENRSKLTSAIENTTKLLR